MGYVFGFGLLGGIAGSVIGILLRPSLFGEQLPVKDVLTRGRMLEDSYHAFAETSFNTVAGVALIGLFVGAIVGQLSAKK